MEAGDGDLVKILRFEFQVLLKLLALSVFFRPFLSIVVEDFGLDALLAQGLDSVIRLGSVHDETVDLILVLVLESDKALRARHDGARHAIRQSFLMFVLELLNHAFLGG